MFSICHTYNNIIIKNNIKIVIYNIKILFFFTASKNMNSFINLNISVSVYVNQLNIRYSHLTSNNVLTQL